MRNLENLMIKAIREFRDNFKNCELIKCYPLEGDAVGNKYILITFGFDYVDVVGEHQYVEITTTCSCKRR